MTLDTLIGLICFGLAAAYALIYEINWPAVKSLIKEAIKNV